MSASVTPCGIVSLTTDFGHKGPFVGVMKGAILRRHPGLRIVDITHDTLAHWPAEAGFWLARSYRYFPPGSVHLAVVDPGVGTDRHILAVQADGHYFVAPDNGLLAPLAALPDATARYLDDATHARLGLGPISATFHGRDILAPLAAALAAGQLPIADVGPLADQVTPSWLDEPQRVGDRVDGVIVTEDHFGNLISNIDAALICGMARPVARFGTQRFVFVDTYGRVSPGEYVALINAFGVVEIARSGQSAAQGLDAGRGAPVRVVDEGAIKKGR